MPQEFYHRFMYIAPSSDHSLLTHVWSEKDAPLTHSALERIKMRSDKIILD